jgi:hypothetical protein
MTMTTSNKINIERVLLIIIATLLIISMTFNVIQFAINRGDTAGGSDTDSEGQVAQDDEAVSQTGDTDDTEDVALAETQAAESEEAPSPEPTVVVWEDDVRRILNPLLPDYMDDFHNKDTWLGYDSEGYASYHIESGRLVGTDYRPNYMNWSYSAASQSGNVYAELSTTNGECSGRDSVGLVIRVDAMITPSGYAMEISCDGAWRFLRLGEGGSRDLVDWTDSVAINTGPGAQNRMGFWGYQSRFVFFVNELQVGNYYDPAYTFTYGFFATYVYASVTPDLQAYFDDFSMWHIPFQP